MLDFTFTKFDTDDDDDENEIEIIFRLTHIKSLWMLCSLNVSVSENNGKSELHANANYTAAQFDIKNAWNCMSVRCFGVCMRKEKRKL